MKKIYSIGIVAGLIPVLFKTILFFSGYTEAYAGSFTNLAELVVIALAIPVAIFVARKDNGGVLPFNSALKIGMAIAATAGIIVCVYTFVYYKYMNTSMAENAVAEATKYAAEKNLSPEDTKKTIGGARQVYSPFVQSTSALFGIMLMGFFVSVISAIALSKEIELLGKLSMMNKSTKRIIAILTFVISFFGYLIIQMINERYGYNYPKWPFAFLFFVVIYVLFPMKKKN